MAAKWAAKFAVPTDSWTWPLPVLRPLVGFHGPFPMLGNHKVPDAAAPGLQIVNELSWIPYPTSGVWRWQHGLFVKRGYCFWSDTRLVKCSQCGNPHAGNILACAAECTTWLPFRQSIISLGPPAAANLDGAGMRLLLRGLYPSVLPRDGVEPRPRTTAVRRIIQKALAAAPPGPLSRPREKRPHGTISTDPPSMPEVLTPAAEGHWRHVAYASYVVLLRREYRPRKRKRKRSII